MAKQSMQTEHYLITVIVLGITTFVVALRAISRYTRKIGIGLDDIFLYAGWSIFLIHAGLNLKSVQLGNGLHTDDVPHKNWPQLLMLMYCLSPVVYTASITLVKFAVLFLYRRVFLSKDIRYGTLVLGVITLLLCIANEAVVIFPCRPLKSRQPKDCLPFDSILIGNAISNFVTDLFILVLPVPAIWRLKATYTKKIMIMLILLSGYITVGISIYRSTLLTDMDLYDPTWTTSRPQTWGVVESGTGVVTASLPALMPVVTFFTKRCSTRFKHRFSRCARSMSRHKSDLSTEQTSAPFLKLEEVAHDRSPIIYDATLHGSTHVSTQFADSSRPSTRYSGPGHGPQYRGAGKGDIRVSQTVTVAQSPSRHKSELFTEHNLGSSLTLGEVGHERASAIYDAALPGNTHVSTQFTDPPATPDGNCLTDFSGAGIGDIRVKQTVTVAESRSAPWP